jgi:DNA-binding Lrp family transcriptional regulator
MESLDLRLLRAIFRRGEYSHLGIEPRKSVVSLAREVHTSRITVRRRLERWRTQGFWNGVAVYPNPDSLGVRFQMQTVVLDADRNRRELESAMLEHLRPFLTFQTESLYAPVLIFENARQSAESQRAFAAAWNHSKVSPPFDVTFPPSARVFTYRDWRIVQALRRGPERSWVTIADEAGVTPRGLERRVVQLVENNALFFFPLLDWRHLDYSIVWTGLLYCRGVDSSRLWDDVRANHPDVLPLDNRFLVENYLPPEIRDQMGGRLLFFVPTRSGSSVDELRREFTEMDGVIDVLAAFPAQVTTLPVQIDSLIESAVGRSRLVHSKPKEPRRSKLQNRPQGQPVYAR